jgi:NADH-quinone oxidoreductase subunit B
MGVEIERNVLVASLEKLVNWGRKYSVWPLTFGLA